MVAARTVLLSTMVFAVAALGDPAATAPAMFTWTNPLSPVARDPQILVADGRYVMAGTAAPFFEQTGPSPGVKLWSSRDLATWDDGTLVIAPSKTSWYRQRFWAPEVYHSRDDGKFYLTFNCPKGGADANTPQAVGVAVADAALGPYRVLTEDAPLCEGNDAHIFRDDDGKTYLFRSGLSAIEVDLPNARVVGESFTVIGKRQGDYWDGGIKGAPAVGLEGPSVVRIDGTYFCFYSSWGRGYEVGYATATNVRGPWTRYVGSPVYGAQDAAWAKRYQHTTDQSPDVPWRQVGHNSLFRGPDGRWWIAAHAYGRAGGDPKNPHLVIDPIDFRAGVFARTPVSATTQSAPIDPAFYPPK